VEGWGDGGIFVVVVVMVVWWWWWYGGGMVVLVMMLVPYILQYFNFSPHPQHPSSSTPLILNTWLILGPLQSSSGKTELIERQKKVFPYII
jgi:hypothetical protein